MKNKGTKIRIYMGKSGAGKDTALKEDVAKGFTPIVSYTTRPMRTGEIGGVDYNFVSHDEFQHLIETNALVEYRTYDTNVQGRKDTWFYGTPKLDLSKNYVGVVTPEGAKAFIDYYGPENIEIIYIDVSDTVRKKRAMCRGSFDETEWNRRLLADAKDFSKDAINALQELLGKPIVYRDNNAEKHNPTFN